MAMSSTQHRWDELVKYVLEEYSAHRQDPNLNFEHDYSKRKLRLRCTFGDDQEWVARTLTDDELRKDDLRVIAKKLYAASLEQGSWPASSS